MSTVTKKMTMAAALNLALDQAMEKDKDVVLLGEDIADPTGGVLKVTQGLSTKYGADRVLDTPISEAGIMGAAIGAAMAGMRAVPEIMIADFLMIAADQLANIAAKHHYTTKGKAPVPLTVRTNVTAHFGSGSTHSQSIEAWFMHMPGLKVAMPSTAYDAKGMLTSAIFDDDPCVFMESAVSYQLAEEVPLDQYTLPIGKASVKREGADISLLSYGPPVNVCLDVARKLEAEGVSVEVIDLRWLVPLDYDTILESVSKTRRAVIVHDATKFAGPGAEIAAMIQEELFHKLLAPVGRVGAPYTPVPASAAAFDYAYYPNVDSVGSAVEKALA